MVTKWYIEFLPTYRKRHLEKMFLIKILYFEYETVADAPESLVWWRADFQTGSRVLKKVFRADFQSGSRVLKKVFSYLYLWLTMWFHAEKFLKTIKFWKSIPTSEITKKNNHTPLSGTSATVSYVDGRDGVVIKGRGRQKDRNTKRLKDKKTKRQKDRKTERQKDKNVKKSN